MESNLRPLTLGEILDRTAQLYRSNFLLFAGIYAVYSGVVLVVNLLQIGLNTWVIGSHPAIGLRLLSVALSLVYLLLIFIFAGAVTAAINRAVAWVHLGEPATIRGAYKSIMPHLGRYLWLQTIVAFIIGAPFVIFCVIAGVVIAFIPGIFSGQPISNNPQSMLLVGIVFGVFVLVMIPWVVYAILMGLRYSLAVPACVVENIKARMAIRRSIELSKGARGRIFLLGLIVVIIGSGLGIFTQGFFVLAAIKHPGHMLPAWMQASQQICGFFTNTFLGPIFAAGITLFYYDQRVRKEGYDIEWMMQAAGLTVPAQAAELPAAAKESQA